MTQALLALLLGIPAGILPLRAENVAQTGNPPSAKTTTASNPILPGFHPDPTICRDGDTYYLATSSFEYFPGVPVYSSKDLVHWDPIGHVLSTRENLDLSGVPCSGGIFAPTLRFHDGTYYMVTTLVGAPSYPFNTHDFIVTATNAAGPWSAPHWIEGAKGIDPSLFFDDDGTVYMCGNASPEHKVHEKHRVIWIQKLNTKTWKLEGPEGILDAAPYFASNKLGSVSNFEGPHLYRKGDYYYLMLSHGGTGMNHAVSIWRSNSPLGPWEENPANPIVTHRTTHYGGINCTGHADLVQGNEGDWWMVLLGVRDGKGKSPMGRETFLAPVDWSGDWPVVNPGPHASLVDLNFTPPHSLTSEKVSRDFRTDFQEKNLSPEWSMIRTPVEPWWDFQTKPGWLSLKLRPEQLTELLQPSFLGLRVTDTSCQATTRVLLNPSDAGECAGLGILRSSGACWMLVVEKPMTGSEVSVYEGIRKLGSLAVKSDQPVDLRIRVAFPLLHFECREEGGDWKQILECEAPALASDQGGRFTGSFVGLYASSRGKPSDNHAAFDFFEYSAVPLK